MYNIKKISEIIHAKSRIIYPNDNIVHLLTDSRKIIHAEKSLFFALIGQRHNGHKFINELYDKGVRNFVLSDKSISIPENCNVLYVENTLNALQELATYHRKQFNLPIIAITGSNGKTIVKEWLYQLLKDDKNIVRSPKSYNSQIGVPLSVWQISKEHNLGIFEAGISKPGEMEKLQKIIQPDISIFTNIGEAHAENFTDVEHKISEKIKLFTTSQTLIYCKDYSLIHNAVKSTYPNIKTIVWSKKSKADLQIAKIEKRTNGCFIQGIYKNHFTEITIPFSDNASIENAINCWVCLLHLGLSEEIISERMQHLSPIEMRLELKEGINNCSIVNDSYNSDIVSLNIALDFICQQKQHEKRTVILSDILQSGKNEEALYKEVALMLEQRNITRLIGIGEALSRQINLFKQESWFYKNTEEFIRYFDFTIFQNEIILLKGARIFGFEQIVKYLQQKAHETVLEINLNAIINNYNYFKSKLKPDTKIMVMVKAFSYGSGSFEIANILQFHHADYLAVAYSDEGVELRKAGITLPIMVMNPELHSYDNMIKYQLEPEIFSFRVLHLFTEALQRNRHLISSPFPIHIKLDTGMHRLGFEEEELNELIMRLKNNKLIKVHSVFSHLAGSDDSSLDDFTFYQINLFKKMSTEIQAHFNYPILRHILNSAGISRFPEAQFEMVRLGIGLHGIGANEYDQSFLQHVSKLKTTISQIKHIKQGDTVGYGRKGIAKKNITIATVPIGYADGYNRKLSNGVGYMLVNGQKAPVIGNVCMDMCMLDVTGINCKEGDEVIVFGEELPVTIIAEQLNTIPYEILTSISRRVKRIYFQE
jgi:alanine racemase